MLAFPPFQLMQVAAEFSRSAFHHGNLKTIGETVATLAACSGLQMFGLNVCMPRYAAIPVLVETGSINGANRLARLRVPVLAVSPMVHGQRHATNLTERRFILGGQRISPDAPVAPVETTGTAIVWASVGHGEVYKDRVVGSSGHQKRPGSLQDLGCSLSAIVIVRRSALLYSGETVRLVRELPDLALPVHTEGTVTRIIRDDQGYPLGAEMEFCPSAGRMTHTVPLDAVELVISPPGGCTAVLWNFMLSPDQLIEPAMHVMLDRDFQMREGPNLMQLHYNREERFWRSGERFTDPAGAYAATAGP